MYDAKPTQIPPAGLKHERWFDCADTVGYGQTHPNPARGIETCAHRQGRNWTRNGQTHPNPARGIETRTIDVTLTVDAAPNPPKSRPRD